MSNLGLLSEFSEKNVNQENIIWVKASACARYCRYAIKKRRKTVFSVKKISMIRSNSRLVAYIIGGHGHASDK